LWVDDNPPSIPNSLEEATVRFREFLRTHGWPDQVQWVSERSFLIGKKGEYWIKPWTNDETLAMTRDKYLEGVKRGLGISISALCRTKSVTFAYVFAPTDREEAARLLIGDLKLSVPVDPCPARLAGNSFLWWFLRCLYQTHTDRFITDILS
jgi:hypothetical protein